MNNDQIVIGGATLHRGDCLEVMRAMADNSVDSIVCDPPYGISFMASHWDYDVPKVDVWREALRVLKPGGYLLAFAGTRTQHRMAVNIEDAGFEIRDMIAWVYSTGFPKSLNVSKAIDKKAGAEREVIGLKNIGCGNGRGVGFRHDGDLEGVEVTAPATESAKQWAGWGTALKPALEPITMARKPLIGTVVENVGHHGTGAINIDACRVEGAAGKGVWGSSNKTVDADRTFVGSPDAADYRSEAHALGRWPANLIHDGSPEVVVCFPAEAGSAAPVHTRNGDKFRRAYWEFAGNIDEQGSTFHGDSGSAARFFYCPKASKEDRDEGLKAFVLQEAGVKNDSGRGFSETDPMKKIMRANHHPTVKPTDLMRYLIRLVTQPGGVTLDPFMGSGSTGKAALLEGFGFVGIEREDAYIEIAAARMVHAMQTRHNETAQGEMFA